MIPRECKRLAEVDFPIAVVSAHAAREKSIRHGHPSTLHLWWARRPLASCRAMLMALLLPDPCDAECPVNFKTEAREILTEVRDPGKSDEDLRKALLWFIGSFANWDMATHRLYLKVARELVKSAHPDEPPLVVDPFAGGGSIPLEALRVGCEAFASDLNPVACLILKVLLEDIPRRSLELAEQVRRVGMEIKQAAEQRLGECYPLDSDGAEPIGYLWTRTVRCETPTCGAEIPLTRSFWLSRKTNNRRAMRYIVRRMRGKPPWIDFEIFEPRHIQEVPAGTVNRAKATCPACSTVIGPDRLRSQLANQHGGADAIFDAHKNRTGGARLLVVVTTIPRQSGRKYRVATENDYKAVWKANAELDSMLKGWDRDGKKGLCPIPDELLPNRNTLGLRVPNYGVTNWGHLFSRRQNLALSRLAIALHNSDLLDADLRRCIALAISRTADYCSANCSLHVGRDVVRNTWARNALPIVWDFYEINPFGSGSGNFLGALDWVSRVADRGAIFQGNRATVQQADAAQSPLPDQGSTVWFTDPPYYSAIGYAESSDFFYTWLKRAYTDAEFAVNPFEPNNPVTPKAPEAIQDDTFQSVYGLKKDASFFEEKLSSAFGEGRRVTDENGIGSVVFAHKTTEGWESLISALFSAGWTVTGSWPIQTEMENKVSGSQTGEKKAMLLASVHLVCRPRPDNAPTGDWEDVLRALPRRVGSWMERLQTEGIRGADLVFACIGPALEIYSRYAQVETAEGRNVSLPEYLEKIWETVGRAALEQVLGTANDQSHQDAASGLEEDARLTALFLWTLQSSDTNGLELTNQDRHENGDFEDDAESSDGGTKGYSLVFDVVRRFAQPLGIHLPVWEDRIIRKEKGVVRLLSVTDRAKQLFGTGNAEVVADQFEKDPVAAMQLSLFPSRGDDVPNVRGRGRKKKRGAGITNEELETQQQATTLDRVHAAMLLQSGGRANALRALLRAEQERGPEFLRLANALSALYPRGSEEKRLLDAMLLAVPR